jgi:hypothetical protein
MTTAAVLDPPQLDLPPGGEASCLLTVRNDTDIVEGYQVEVLGDAEAWADVNPPTLRLYPGSDASVMISFRMPRTAKVAVREIPFAVRVTPMERPDNIVVPEGLLRVGALAELGGDLLPETSKARRSAQHDVAIDNTGNVPVRVTVQGSDPEEALTVRSRPVALVIPPGQAAIAQLRVKHRSWLWKGKPVPRKFRVSVTSPDVPPVLLEGTAVQRPVVGPWMWKAALALLALALIAAGLWAGLVKPAVKSAADKAAKDAVAVSESQQAVAAEKSASANGNSGGSAANNQASASAGAGQGGTNPTANASAAATSYYQTISVDAATGKTTKKDVSRTANTRLEISYLQLQAPQGDTATLRVLIGDQVLFPYQLYNIRIYDAHPQPAIVVPADKTLRLELQCTTPGTDPQGNAYTACRVDIQFTGSTFPAT